MMTEFIALALQHAPYKPEEPAPGLSTVLYSVNPGNSLSYSATYKDSHHTTTRLQD